MDRVQVLKRESAALGGDDVDTAPWPEPISPQEDALEAAGLYGQDPSNRDETTLIWRDGNDWKFKDINNAVARTLTQLLGIAAIPVESGTPPDESHVQYDAISGTWKYVSVSQSGATAVGQVLISLDGSTFTAALPVIDDVSGSWIADDFGELVVEG